MEYSASGPVQDKEGASIPPEIDALVSQLAFIRRYHRYPLDGKKLWQVLSALTMVPLPLMFLFWGYATVPVDSVYPFWKNTMLIWVLMPFIVAIQRYWQHVRFASVRTSELAWGTEQMLLSFLRDQHLRFEKHPQIEGLYWIRSKSVYWKSDMRELIFFVVDDQRILIQGGFTGTDKRRPLGIPRHRKLTRTLRSWMANGRVQNSEWAYY